MSSFKCEQCNETYHLRGEDKHEHTCKYCKRTLLRNYRLEERVCDVSTLKDKIERAALVGLPYTKIQVLKMKYCNLRQKVINFKNKKVNNINIKKKWKRFKNWLW